VAPPNSKAFCRVEQTCKGTDCVNIPGTAQCNVNSFSLRSCECILTENLSHAVQLHSTKVSCSSKFVIYTVELTWGLVRYDRVTPAYPTRPAQPAQPVQLVQLAQLAQPAQLFPAPPPAIILIYRWHSLTLTRPVAAVKIPMMVMTVLALQDPHVVSAQLSSS
jgi:hypothetical protein